MIYHRCTDCRGSYFLPSITVDARVPVAIVDDRVMIVVVVVVVVVAAVVAAAAVDAAAARVSPARFFLLNQIS